MRLASRIKDEVLSVSPLRRASLSPSTFKEYALRTSEFVAFLNIEKPSTASFEEVDKSLCEFGVYLYDLNPRLGSLQHFHNALFGTIFFLPELKSHLCRSRQLEKG